ncbi:glycoside hydrolase family 97 protein [Sphingobacterium corticibacterium]|uniref:Glycoside hydrolase family 97 protein n=1 Tax=Sphingobacterium corticibacterium TaxID=2484746 RepID=A0A4Q6XJ34_9SPHI|nr:glycoside hydrolase family 97 protein [Sphingobacterium corticibacterium]RZF59305.1 glycoside hydrolase family 97 protein [Sphingobacterium corticibacterium]
MLLKRFSVFLLSISIAGTLSAQETKVQGPDGNLSVSFSINEGRLFYSLKNRGETVLENSPLGLYTNEGDFVDSLSLVDSEMDKVEKTYEQDRIKTSKVTYKANVLRLTVENGQKNKLSVVFQVSDHDVAFRYELPVWGERRSAVVLREETGYRFPENTTAFLSNMMTPMTAFARTAPSYESGYIADAPLAKAKSKYGFVFPGLFRIGNTGWALLSETGVSSLYCASHLSEISTEGVFHVAYPDMAQNNGFGSTGAAVSLPAVTPWRTITVGNDLQPIVETTIPFDVVEPLYEASQQYKFGKSTWSWIVWQDQSMNWKDQVTYIDLASDLGYPYILVDAFWDENLGKEKLEELVQYAKSKNVDIFLWYNSNGAFNDAPQGPRNKMNTSIVRKSEMKWLQRIGVKGLKVDFLGGDKQETMRLYEDILSDANDHGLMVIFHGATLPRGWERMYPNYVGSEAVIASEMLIFSQHARDNEAFYATLHPFIRNTVGSMEFGGVLLNKYLHKENKDRNKRLTTDAFQLATAVLFQNPVQPFALTPNNLSDVPSFEIDFMRNVPTTWDETRFIAGYPGKYAVLARRHGEKWYLAGVNAEDTPQKIKLHVGMLGGGLQSMISDKSDGTTYQSNLKIDKRGEVEVTIQPKGGIVIF